MYINKLDNPVNNSDEKDIIWLVKNTKDPQAYLAQLENRVTGNSELEEKERLKEMIEKRMDINIFM